MVAVLVVAIVAVLEAVQVVLGAWLVMDTAIVVPYVSDVILECHAVLVVMKILAIAVVFQNAMVNANTV